jgi:hypothetical protein
MNIYYLDTRFWFLSSLDVLNYQRQFHAVSFHAFGGMEREKKEETLCLIILHQTIKKMQRIIAVLLE